MSHAPAGWYQAQGDPPGTERYWDGTSWGTETREAPRAAAPPPPVGVPSQFGAGGAAPNTMRSHEIDYEIFGDDLQFVEVELDPGETVIGEAGTMMMLHDGIQFASKMGDGTEPDKGARTSLSFIDKASLIIR